MVVWAVRMSKMASWWEVLVSRRRFGLLLKGVRRRVCWRVVVVVVVRMEVLRLAWRHLPVVGFELEVWLAHRLIAWFLPW
jgi:hypothetical protein